MTLTYEEAIQAVDHLCSPVGLRSIAVPAPTEGIEMPEGVLIWQNSYSLLVVWPVSGQDLDVALQNAASASEVFIESLLDACRASRPGHRADAYLVFLVSGFLTEEAEIAIGHRIRELELSTAICRRHVVWRNSTSTRADLMQHLQRVSVLGLPALATSLMPTGSDWPTLSTHAGKFWSELQSDSVAAYVKRIGLDV